MHTVWNICEITSVIITFSIPPSFHLFLPSFSHLTLPHIICSVFIHSCVSTFPSFIYMPTEMQSVSDNWSIFHTQMSRQLTVSVDNKQLLCSPPLLSSPLISSPLSKLAQPVSEHKLVGSNKGSTYANVCSANARRQQEKLLKKGLGIESLPVSSLIIRNKCELGPVSLSKAPDLIAESVAAQCLYALPLIHVINH